MLFSLTRYSGVDGLGGDLALRSGPQRRPWPGYRSGILHDDRHLPHAKVHLYKIQPICEMLK